MSGPALASAHGVIFRLPLGAHPSSRPAGHLFPRGEKDEGSFPRSRAHRASSNDRPVPTEPVCGLE